MANIFEKFFGFSLKSSDRKEKVQNNLKSFVPPTQRDGAVVVDQQPFGYGGYFYSTPYQANRLANEFELITKYRQMALHPIVAKAIEEICNEAIVSDEAGTYKLDIDLDEVKISDEVKQKIIAAFDKVLKLCQYSSRAYDLFKQHYIDGKLYNAIIVDDENLKEGIKDVRLFDPRQIQLVRNITRDTSADLSSYGNSSALVRLIDEVEEYFVFNPYGIYSTYINTAENITGIRIETDSVSYVTSGLMDAENQIVISYLEQASKVLNQLSDLEDSMVIYRMSRSSEKRIFYVDVGKMAHSKASAYIRGIAEKYKTKIVYDPSTGKVDIGNNQRSLVEDIFIPVREGNATKIETLQGGQALDNIPDLDYFWKLLTKSLNVPATRLQESSAYSIGKSSEITRDEISFKKFISRLQLKFGEFPLHLLKVELELTGIMPGEEFEKIRQDIILNFATDNFFYEMKEAEILSLRASTANDISSVNEIHQIFSSKWIKQHIFKLTDEEIAQNDAEIKAERIKRASMGLVNPDEEDPSNPMGGTTMSPEEEVSRINDSDSLPAENPEEALPHDDDIKKSLDSVKDHVINSLSGEENTDEETEESEPEDEDIETSLDSVKDHIVKSLKNDDDESDEEDEEKDEFDESTALIAKYINSKINN